MKKKIAGIVVAALIGAVSLTAFASPASAAVGCGYSDPELQYACNLFEFYSGRDFNQAEASYWAGVGQQFGHTVESLALVHSAEVNSQLVDELYEIELGRAGDANGIEYWTDLLDSSQLQWEQVFGIFGDSTEGRATMTNDQFTTFLYEFWLERDPSADELAYWSGIADSVNRLAVADGISHSDESASRLVTLFFEQLVGRAPTDADVLYWGGVFKTYGYIDVAALLAGTDEAFTHISQVSAPVVAGALMSAHAA